MNRLMHHKNFYIAIAVLAVAVVFFGLDSQGRDIGQIGMLDVVNGRLPQSNIDKLEWINLEIKNARSILEARLQVVKILAADNCIRQFEFIHGALWVDDRLVLKDVDRFHFEYRDAFGNLLTRADQQRQAINMVAYILNASHHSQSVLGCARIPIRSAAKVQFAAL
ncbi:hypothetical protein KAR48_00305 [bacterium]|nr:hypothetical protein [bacterium]